MSADDAGNQPRPVQPDAALERLGRLVGTWQGSEEAQGTVTYGSTLDYVYELDGHTLTGAWVYPGGGGYSTVTTRVNEDAAGARRPR
jgi:hypothetical protein